MNALDNKDTIIQVLFIICTIAILLNVYLIHSRDTIYKQCEEGCHQWMIETGCIDRPQSNYYEIVNISNIQMGDLK